MGKEVVYCSKCQKRILGTEYAKGLAYQVQNRIFCSTCAVQELETLSPKAKEQLLAKMFKATHDREASNSGDPRSMDGPPSSPSARRLPSSLPPARRAGAGPRSSTSLIAVIVVAVVALILLVIGLSRGNSSPDPVTTASVKGPTPSPPPSGPGSSPEDKRRAENASAAMRKAMEFAQANPMDLDGQLRQWHAALLEAERTGYELEVKRQLEKAEVRIKERIAQELADLELRVKAPISREEFKAALDLLDQALARRASPEWAALINRLQREVHDTARRLFALLKEKAVASRDRGAKAEVEAAKTQVAKWGLPGYIADLDAALVLPWRPIFDGKTTSFLVGECAASWQVVDGALTRTPGTPNQAGQSRDDFGDGEFRFRVSFEGVTHCFIAVRQGNGACQIEYHRAALVALGGGVHEVVFTCLGNQVSANMDGSPVKVEIVRRVLPRGRLQFDSTDGVFRIHAVDVRALR